MSAAAGVSLAEVEGTTGGKKEGSDFSWGPVDSVARYVTLTQGSKDSMEREQRAPAVFHQAPGGPAQNRRSPSS
jgi:hypothetical protein